MPLSFMKDTVTVLRAPFVMKNGEQCFDWKNAQSISISNVQVTAQASTRDFEGRLLQVTDRRTLRAPYDADIQAGDCVVWNGETYEVDGEVYHTKSPTGRISSTRCTLVRFQG